MMKRVIIVSLLLLSAWAAYPQKTIDAVKQLTGLEGSPKMCRNAVIDYRFGDAIELYAAEIKHRQSNLKANQTVDGDILAEYAYALALNHNFEYALVNIDRARTLKARHADFYTNQILSLMGEDELANAYRFSNIPKWVGPYFSKLYHKRVVNPHVEDSLSLPRSELEHVRQLANSAQYVQALVLLRHLQHCYPDEHILLSVESAIWETTGNRPQAANCMDEAIKKTGRGDDRELVAEYNVKLSELKSSGAAVVGGIKQVVRKSHIRTMVYAGGTIAKGNYSLNTRVGFYTSTQFSASLNLSFMFMEESFNGSLGISGYKTWKFLLGGLGLSYMFGGETGAVSLVPTVGVTFPNKSQTASFDVTFSCYIPLTESAKFSYGLSFGRTFYF